MNQLYSTKFIERLLKGYSNLGREDVNKTPNKPFINIYALDYGDKSDIYLKKVAERWWLLREYLERLGKIKNIFSYNYPNIGFEEIEWWHYNYENFLLRLSATLDQVSKLVNEVYELNISERDCNWSRVRDKIKAVNPKCSAKISDFQKFLDSYINARNEVAHKGGYESDDIKAIDSYYFDEFEKQFFGEELFNEMIQKKNAKRIALVEELGSIIDKTKDHLREVIITVEDQFLSKTKLPPF